VTENVTFEPVCGAAVSDGPAPHISLTKILDASILQSVIELNHVSYEYPLARGPSGNGEDGKSILALDDVSLRLEQGTSLAIIGSNGSGKTTLVKLLNALLVPQKGEVWIDGLNTKDKHSQRLVRQKVGMVFQNPDNQIISTSVEREIAFGLENLALPYDEMKTRVGRALKYFNLEQYRNHPPHRLSGGEKQKVALAAVLSMQPDYLVLDEPTSLLDPLGRREVLALIQILCEERNVTVIHVTQFPEEAVSANMVMVMHRGRILLYGPPAEVFGQEDQLNQAGLGVPFPMRIASALRRRSWAGLDECLTMDVLVDGIVENVKRGRQKPGAGGGGATDGGHALSEAEGPRTTDRGRSTVDGRQPPQIALHQVSHVYDHGLPTERKALDRISLKIKKGEFVGLIGPTGSGKSTLVQHLNGLLLSTSGEVSVEQVNLKEKNVDLKKIRQKVGLVFQFPELQLFEETVYDDIAFGPKNLGLSEQDVDGRVRESMSKVGLNFEQFASRSPFHLSGGEQRKVAIAGTLALEPEILVLDEPTCGLDRKSTNEIKELLREFNSGGVTIILISHNMDLIAELTEKIILLDQGRLLAFEDKEEFFRDADRIRSVGLDLPRIVELVWKLRNEAIAIEEMLFTEEQLIAGLMRVKEKQFKRPSMK
jgi:energy-coupling factor transporter ATPase